MFLPLLILLFLSLTFCQSQSVVPSFNIPISRYHVDLVSIDQNGHRAMNVFVGSQSLRLIVDTGSADLLLLNFTYCARAVPTNGIARACYQPTNSLNNRFDWSSAIQVSYANDGEDLVDYSSQNAAVIANLPINMTGLNTLINIGRGVSDQVNNLSPGRIYGYPWPGTLFVNALISAPDTVYPSLIPYSPFPYLLNSWNSLLEVDGIIGLGSRSLSRSLSAPSLGNSTKTAWEELMQSISAVNDAEWVYSIDTSTNRLLLGGIDSAWENSLVWTEPATNRAVRQSNNQALYSSFYTRDFSICGVNLQSIYSHQPIESIIDTGSSCLTLPSEMFDSLVSWLPVTCTSTTDIDSDTIDDVSGGANNQPINQPVNQNLNFNTRVNPSSRYCWLSVDQSTNQLPIISFKINHLKNQTMYLPLTDLLTPSRSSTTQPQRLCLVRSTSLFDRTTPPLIVYGSRAFSSVNQVFVPSRSRVALMNHPSIKQSVAFSNQSCVARVQCLGQQKLDAIYNVCTLPDCSSYFFWSYNTETARCEIAAGFHAILAIFIIVFLGGELLLNEGVIHMAKKVQGIQTNRRQARRRR